MLKDELLLAWWRLRRLRGIGTVAANEIRSQLLNPEDLIHSTTDDLIRLGCSESQAQQFTTDSSLSQGFELLQAWQSEPDQGVLLAGCYPYPESLASLRDAPTFLWYRGDIAALNHPMVAIVGSRGASREALQWTHECASTLAAAGITVVSGLALGIDAAAHEGALGSGRTIAVMGTGPDITYPARHRRLADDIRRQGLLLTEFEPGTAPQSRHFPSRNRIISGLCQATIVAEAGLRSGSMITARAAAEQGRDVFAVPGSLANPLSHGPHQLIREGALLIRDGNDVLDELNHFRLTAPAPIAATAPTPSGTTAPALLGMIDFAPTPVDVIAIRSARQIHELLPELLQLELEGWLTQSPGGYCRQR